jgi:polynucleotide 5'-kinase involved in rRNA processing
VPFDEVEVEGARLGAGIPFGKPLPGAHYAESCGATLLIVSEVHLDDHMVSSALDSAHASRAVVVRPDDYNGLLCAFSKANGDCFGMGVIQNVDFERRVFHVLSTAVPPAPVRILRVGGLRLSLDGDELGEIRPWQV